MSILTTEQSERYIDSLRASVQALEADLAATRDRLRQAQGRTMHTDCDCPDCRPIDLSIEHAGVIDDLASRLHLAKSELEQAEARIAALEADAKLASTDEILRVWRETSKADARGREGRLAERLGLFTVMSAPEIGGKVVHFHESSPELFTDAQAALRAYAQLLRRVEAVERERAEAFRLLRKAQAQASNVMQTWYEGEDEALAALGLRWPWELDGEPGVQK